ncbi:oxaloacetate decarboxylase [Patescibacteria group bacterium AH-259-L05]|nr:oxaloacetate decarboxylase [Patescibacteria group bacterium AH-259-L05]
MSKQHTNIYATRFRNLIRSGSIRVPGTFYPFGALQIKAAGFDTCYISGAAVSNSLGLIDEGYVSREDMEWTVKKVLAVADIPLIVDGDTGLLPRFKIQQLWEIRQSSDENAFVRFCLEEFKPLIDEKLAVFQTVKTLEKAGIAAIHFEDQDWRWKRCGHLNGKHLISIEKMTEKIREACRARKTDVVIIARTDARAVEGLESAIRRGNAYRAAGADMIFPEALETLDEFQEFRKQVQDIPLVANLAEHGKTEAGIRAQDLERANYSVIIFPATGTRMMFYAFEEFLKEIQEKGTATGIVQQERLISRLKVNEFLHKHSRRYKK